jgi:hypothetical protein
VLSRDRGPVATPLDRTRQLKALLREFESTNTGDNHRKVCVTVDDSPVIEIEMPNGSETRNSARALESFLRESRRVVLCGVVGAEGYWNCFRFRDRKPLWSTGLFAEVEYLRASREGGGGVLRGAVYPSRGTSGVGRVYSPHRADRGYRGIFPARCPAVARPLLHLALLSARARDGCFSTAAAGGHRALTAEFFHPEIANDAEGVKILARLAVGS